MMPVLHGLRGHLWPERLKAVPNLFNLISQKYFKGSVWRLTIIFYKGIKKI